MQLISYLLILLSLLLLGAAVQLVVWCRRWSRRLSLPYRLREGIAHIGISTVVAYPETVAPLIALLEEEYPCSEAILVADLQRSSFGGLITQFHLVRVNHTHLEGVRAFYRSHHRPFRRVVVVDLPTEYRAQAPKVGRVVASYDYLLQLQGESIVEPNAVAYCAAVAASQSSAKAISLESMVGTMARLEKVGVDCSKEPKILYTTHALAWQKRGVWVAVAAMLLPAVMASIAYLLGSRLILLSAAIMVLAVGMFLYVSCRVITEKGVFATLDTILQNFYRYLVERVKNYHYLYKGRGHRADTIAEGVPMLRNREQNHNRKPL